MLLQATKASDKEMGRNVVVNDFDGDGCDDIMVWDFDAMVPYNIEEKLGRSLIVGFDIYPGGEGVFQSEYGFQRPTALLVVPNSREDLPIEYQDIKMSLRGAFSPDIANRTIDADKRGIRDILVSRYAMAENTGNSTYEPGTIAYVISSEYISEMIKEGRTLREE